MRSGQLSHELVWDRSQELWFIVLGADNMSWSWSNRESLAGSSSLATGLGICLPDLVGVDSVKEILPALAVLHMLNPDIDSLGQDLATHSLVDNNSNCSLGHIEHTTSLAMVGLVRHSLLESSAT